MTSHQGKMPLIPTFYQELQHFWSYEVKIKNGILQGMLFMDEETGKIGWGCLICAYCVPFISIIAYRMMLFNTFKNPEDLLAKT